MNYATRAYLSKLILISLFSSALFIYLGNVLSIDYETLSTLLSLYNTLLSAYYYQFIYNKRKEKVTNSLPINKNLMFYGPIFAIFLQSLLVDINYLDSLTYSSAFATFNKYLIPSLTLMFLSSGHSLLNNALSIGLLSLFSISTLNGLDFFLNNLTFINLGNSHPIAVIIVVLVILASLLLARKTYNIHKKEHNYKKLKTYFYLELVIFITLAFQKLFVIKQPFQTFFATINFMNYQIVWVNVLIAVVLVILLVKFVYNKVSRKLVLIYLLPLFLITSLYIMLDKALDRSNIGCEMLAVMNANNYDNTIWFNNVPLVSYNNIPSDALIHSVDQDIQGCMSNQDLGSDLIFFGINYNYLNDNHLDILVKNDVIYLVNNDFGIENLFVLNGDIKAISIFNYSDLMDDIHTTYLFVLLPPFLSPYQELIQERLDSKYPSLNLTFISDHESFEVLGDSLSHYNQVNVHDATDVLGNVNITMLGLAGGSYDLDYANVLLTRNELFSIPALAHNHPNLRGEN